MQMKIVIRNSLKQKAQSLKTSLNGVTLTEKEYEMFLDVLDAHHTPVLFQITLGGTTYTNYQITP
jgi:hypothetical protein